MLGIAVDIWRPVYSGASEPIPPGTPAVWHSAYNTAYTTVNTDGTGGAPAIDAAIGRFTDRTGNGYHAIQATAAARLVNRGGYASVPDAAANAGTRVFAQSATAGYGGTTQAVTGLIIVDAALFPADMIPFTFSGGTEQSAAWPCRNVYLAYRGNASTLEFWINGVQYSRAAIASVALSVINIGTSASTTTSHRRFYENILYASALNDTDFALLRAYGSSRVGLAGIGINRLIAVGDSRTFGYNSLVSSPWIRQTTPLANYIKYNYGIGGAQAAFFAVNLITDVPKYMGAGRNVVVVWLGTNDLSSGKTAAQTEASIATVCQTWQRMGARVIVCSEIYRSAGVSNATIDALNALLSANWSTYADRYCNLIARSELQNPANGTYFADGLHLTDAGEGIVAAEVSSAINAIDADFTQSAQTVVSGGSITFTDTTINTPSAWTWDVDGGGTDSTAQNPTIAFNTPGVYSPTLTAVNSNGSTTRTKSSSIIVASSLTVPTNNLVLFFDKGNASGATWTDTSGLARDMTLFNSPSIASGVVTFNGTTQYGKTAAYATNRPVFVMMRVKLVAWTSGAAIMDGDTSLSWLVYSPGASPNIGWYPGGGPLVQNNTFVIGSFATFSVGNKLNGLQVAAKIDSTEATAYAGTRAGATGFTLAREGGAATRFGNIAVSAIAGWSAVPSAAEIAQAEAYMGSL